MLEERKAVAAVFTSDKQALLAVQIELNTGVRPLPAESLQGVSSFCCDCTHHRLGWSSLSARRAVVQSYFNSPYLAHG